LLIARADDWLGVVGRLSYSSDIGNGFTVKEQPQTSNDGVLGSKQIMEFQTRSNDGDIAFHKTMQAALDHANGKKDIWKISFTIPETGEKISFNTNK
jgi:hypothetical protein